MSAENCWSRKTVTQRFGFIIAAAVTLFWLWFSIASALGEGQNLTGFLMHILLPGMLLLLPVVLAWRWEGIAGILLIAVAVFTVFFFHTFSNWFTLLFLTAPPLIAGLLLIPFRMKRSGYKDEESRKQNGGAASRADGPSR